MIVGFDTTRVIMETQARIRSSLNRMSVALSVIENSNTLLNRSRAALEKPIPMLHYGITASENIADSDN